MERLSVEPPYLLTQCFHYSGIAYSSRLLIVCSLGPNETAAAQKTATINLTTRYSVFLVEANTLTPIMFHAGNIAVKCRSPECLYRGGVMVFPDSSRAIVLTVYKSW